MNRYLINRLSPFILSIVMLTSGIFIAGCSSNSAPSGDATVTTSSEMDQTTVKSRAMDKGQPVIQTKGSRCDSIQITRARILISNLKMHHDDGDTAGKGTIKIGPFLAEFNGSAGAKIISTVSVPAGTYDRIKLEFHKLSNALDATLIADPIFAEFATSSRNTVIVEGKSYKNGTMTPFTYRSSLTDNLQVKFDPAITLEGGQNYNIGIKFDPFVLFAVGANGPLDPTDVDNQKDIEAQIKLAIKAYKK